MLIARGVTPTRWGRKKERKGDRLSRGRVTPAMRGRKHTKYFLCAKVQE